MEEDKTTVTRFLVDSMEEDAIDVVKIPRVRIARLWDSFNHRVDRNKSKIDERSKSARSSRIERSILYSYQLECYLKQEEVLPRKIVQVSSYVSRVLYT